MTTIKVLKNGEPLAMLGTDSEHIISGFIGAVWMEARRDTGERTVKLDVDGRNFGTVHTAGKAMVPLTVEVLAMLRWLKQNA